MRRDVTESCGTWKHERMGLIRNTLNLVVPVKTTSKKQRSANAIQKQAEALNRSATQAAVVARQTAKAADAKAAEEARFRYDTDPVYRQWADEQEATKQGEEAARLADTEQRKREYRERMHAQSLAELRAKKEARQKRQQRIERLTFWKSSS